MENKVPTKARQMYCFLPTRCDFIIPSREGWREATGCVMRNKILPYDPKLKEIAVRLRKNSTLSEVLLWEQLKQGKMMGYDFHRQKPIDRYIVDFFCHDLMLAIEIDGCTHDFKYEYDQEREQRLNKLGISVIHIQDKDVKTNLPGVLGFIKNWVMERRRNN